MCLKILLQPFITKQLLLEFISPFSLHLFIIQSLYNILHSAFDFDQLLPYHGDAFYHVFSTERLQHLSLVQI